MKNIIFFDTETTGNTEEDYMIQLAYKTKDEEFSGLYKAKKPTPPEASAVHHITNKMLEGKPAFKESPEYAKIKELFESEDTVMVAHNALFDLMILKNEDINPKNFICTLRLARHLDPEDKISRYNLQYLRYFLEIEVEATAHDALGDVTVLEKLYERLAKKVEETENTSGDEVVKKMMEISSHPSIFRTINFGKHNGKKIEEILRLDRGYLEWLYTQKKDSDQTDEDWIYTLEHYLKK